MKCKGTLCINRCTNNLTQPPKGQAYKPVSVYRSEYSQVLCKKCLTTALHQELKSLK